MKAPAAQLARPADPGRLAMWIFIATEVLFFGGLFVAYMHGRMHWPQGFASASRHTDVLLGTLNTAVLLGSSALVAMAADCAGSTGEVTHRRATVCLMLATAGLGIVFLAIKGLEYGKEWREGLFPGPGFRGDGEQGEQLFFALYFVMTAVHALHLVIGIGIVLVLAQGRWRGRAWASAARIDIAALYWHFVDIVWVFLYPLLYLVSRNR